MRIALVELPARFGAPERGLADLETLLASEPRPDLALLPEASLTGYVSPTGEFDLTHFAEPLSGPTVRRVREIARRLDIAIGAPLIEREGDHVFNAYVVVARDGELLAHYRKRHPWFPETWATPGDAPLAVFTLGGVAFTIAICFDVHFLSTDGVGALEASDVLLFPSAWVEGASADERAALLGDLARSLGIVVANPNWGPGTPLVVGQGASRFVGPDGEIARATSRRATALRLDAIVGAKAC